MKPEVSKHPTEYYGYPHSDDSDEAETAWENESCPFTGEKCTKTPKAADSMGTLGTCSIGHRSRGGSYEEHVTCPTRFETDTVFDEAKSNLVDEGEAILRPEVNLMGDKIDFVAGKVNDDNELIDFTGIEIQALDTTGSVGAYRDAYVEGRDYDEVEKDLGINWKESLVKEMLQQAYNKGTIFDGWGENIIFILQDVSLRYIRNNYDASELRPSNSSDPVHFFTFSLEYDDDKGRYLWEPDEKVSTDIGGIEKMRDADSGEIPPTRDEFASSVMDKIGD